jgi:hypothetical protein
VEWVPESYDNVSSSQSNMTAFDKDRLPTWPWLSAPSSALNVRLVSQRIQGGQQGDDDVAGDESLTESITSRIERTLRVAGLIRI